jgi:hypothetical protein
MIKKRCSVRTQTDQIKRVLSIVSKAYCLSHQWYQQKPCFCVIEFVTQVVPTEALLALLSLWHKWYQQKTCLRHWVCNTSGTNRSPACVIEFVTQVVPTEALLLRHWVCDTSGTNRSTACVIEFVTQVVPTEALLASIPFLASAVQSRFLPLYNVYWLLKWSCTRTWRYVISCCRKIYNAR